MSLEDLVKFIGLHYRYTDRNEVWLSDNVQLKMLENFRSHWRHQFPDFVGMQARRLNMVTELMGMNLITKEEAMKLVGLDSISE